MSWRDDLRPASFRGVAFQVNQSNDTFGRRSVLHKYPGRDTGDLEELGLDIPQYDVDAYLVGNDYMAALVALKAALLQAGPGDLVHPYYGTMEVSVLPGIRVNQSMRYGGMAQLSFTFVQTEEKKFPDEVNDTRFSVARLASIAEEALGVSFESVFDVLSDADYVLTEASKVIREGIDTINSVASSIISAGNDLTAFVGLIEEAQGAVGRLLGAPGVLAQRLIGSVQGLLFLNSSDDTTSKNYRAPLRSVVKLTSFGDDLRPVAETTPSRIVQARNQAAVVALIRRAAVVAAARAAADIDFTSYEDAKTTRDELAVLFEAEIVTAADAGDDVSFEALSLVRAAMMEDISVRGAQLSRLGSFTPPETMPAFVIAYQLYGDASRADEIVARNRIRHPGFVPGGVPLEVLLDA